MTPTRRHLLKAGSLLAGLPLLPLAGCQAAPGAAAGAGAGADADARAGTGAPVRSAVDEVDLFIGTGGHGHTTPAATLPFGMVQLGPDTDNAAWDACSGYHEGDGSIMGFSHTHLSGTGIGDLLDVLVMPCAGPVRDDPGPLDDPARGWRAPFLHADEAAEPGYYRVALRDRGVTAECTATLRTGWHRYTFSPGHENHLVVDLLHGMQDNPATPTRVPFADLRVVDRQTLTGGRTVDQWARGRHLYFAMRLSMPMEGIDVYTDAQLGQAPARGGVSGGNGDGARRDGRIAQAPHPVRAVLHLPASAVPQVLLVKVGLSAVSAENALRNLDAESPGWDFDAVRGAARAAWERQLGTLRMTAADAAGQRMLTTALYHCLLAPTTFSDVDGRYRGMDLGVHAAGTRTPRTHYTQYSLWDTYRALHPLLTLLLPPAQLGDIVGSLVDMAAQSPDGVPVWPLQARETGCMSGYHSVAVVAEACVKGIPGVDYRAGYALWRRWAMASNYRGLALYRDRGYIPADLEEEGTSKTLEYAYDDWALAAWAGRLGRRDDQAMLAERSRCYANQFDPATGFIRPRLADGRWASPFDPRALGHDTKRWRDFTECNAWQATFLNQHDVAGCIAALGGDAGFVAKLDALFDADPALPADAPPDISGQIGQYAHGNEPSHHVAYLYAYAGQPWKTQARVRQIMQTLYSDAPDGLAGNEDCGQMSAWLVFSALGLYPVDPVSGNYVFGSPLVQRAELALADARVLVVEAPGNRADTVYVQSVQWNGSDWPRSWIGHATLLEGGRLTFTMGSTPNPTFGADPVARPPMPRRPAAAAGDSGVQSAKFRRSV